MQPFDIDKETCRICGKKYTRISSTHLRGHGLTRQEYMRLAWNTLPGRLTPTSAVPGAIKGARTAAVAAARDIITNTKAMSDFSDEVAAVMMDGPLKNQLASSVASLLHERMIMHGQASAFMNTVRNELQEDWRVKHGGEGGGPTPTATLVNMGHLALTEVRHAEDLVLRTIKVALEEMQRNPAAQPGAQGFKAGAEGVPIPASLSPAERETIRLLHSAIVKRSLALAKTGDNVIDVETESTQKATEVSSAAAPPEQTSAPSADSVSIRLPAQALDF